MRFYSFALLAWAIAVSASPSAKTCREHQGDIKNVRSNMEQPVKFCRWFNSVERTLSPLSSVGPKKLNTACGCIMKAAGVKAKPSPNRQGSRPNSSLKCNRAHETTLKRQFSKPLQFCRFFNSADRATSPLDGLSVKELFAGCKCLLQPPPPPPTTKKTTKSQTTKTTPEPSTVTTTTTVIPIFPTTSSSSTTRETTTSSETSSETSSSSSSTTQTSSSTTLPSSSSTTLPSSSSTTLPSSSSTTLPSSSSTSQPPSSSTTAETSSSTTQSSSSSTTSDSTSTTTTSETSTTSTTTTSTTSTTSTSSTTSTTTTTTSSTCAASAPASVSVTTLNAPEATTASASYSVFLTAYGTIATSVNGLTQTQYASDLPIAEVASSCAQVALGAQNYNTQTDFEIVYYTSGGSEIWICGVYTEISEHNAAAYTEPLDGAQCVFGFSQRNYADVSGLSTTWTS